MNRRQLVFNKIRNTECDFCHIKRRVVTAVNKTTYICHVCAIEINDHACTNWNVSKQGETVEGVTLEESDE
jgi:hypothetical protein